MITAEFSFVLNNQVNWNFFSSSSLLQNFLFNSISCLLQQPAAENWVEEHRHCCFCPSWKDRLSEAQRQPAARLKKTATSKISIVGDRAEMDSASLVEETATMICAESSSALFVDKQTVRDHSTADSRSKRRQKRREERREALEVEKAAARSRTRENVLRHYALPAALVAVAAGLMAGGAWIMRRRLRWNWSIIWKRRFLIFNVGNCLKIGMGLKRNFTRKFILTVWIVTRLKVFLQN